MAALMKELLGQKLVKENMITEEQLQSALARQMRRGGRLGRNLIALGLLSHRELSSFFNKHIDAPETLEETGLELSFLTDLVLKHVLFRGGFTIADVAASVKLPRSIVNAALEELRNEKFIEVKGASQYTTESYKFQLTEQGKNRASELLDICRYVGPAPVVLDQYWEMVELQTIRSILVDEDSVKKAFSPSYLASACSVVLACVQAPERRCFFTVLRATEDDDKRDHRHLLRVLFTCLTPHRRGDHQHLRSR
jgi:hypothetical protein